MLAFVTVDFNCPFNALYAQQHGNVFGWQSSHPRSTQPQVSLLELIRVKVVARVRVRIGVRGRVVFVYSHISLSVSLAVCPVQAQNALT